MGYTPAPAPFLALKLLQSSLHTELLKHPVPGALGLAVRALSFQGLTQGFSSVAHDRTEASPGVHLWKAGPAGPGPSSPHHAMTHLQHPVGVVGPGCSREPPFLGGSSESKCHLQFQRQAPQEEDSQREALEEVALKEGRVHTWKSRAPRREAPKWQQGAHPVWSRQLKVQPVFSRMGVRWREPLC